MRSFDLLGVELPIIQAPMAGSQDTALALAASEAGALGSLPCAMLDLAALEGALRTLREKSSRPFNVNFFCHRTPDVDVAREEAFREALAPYYRELGVDPASITGGAGRVPFSRDAADVLATHPPAIISFHFGLPDPVLVAEIKRWGTKILGCATTVEEGLWLEARGVDAIIAQGVEAGGHRGMFLSSDITTQVATMALVPQLVHAVRVPVIAAGGIATKEGVRAARALGAAAVQVGTAYLTCPEATTSALHRAALASEAVHHTALTNLFTGRPARGIVNRFMRALGPMSALAPAFPRATAHVQPLRQAAEQRGLADFSPLWAGQSASLCTPRSAAEVTLALAEGL